MCCEILFTPIVLCQFADRGLLQSGVRWDRKATAFPSRNRYQAFRPAIRNWEIAFSARSCALLHWPFGLIQPSHTGKRCTGVMMYCKPCVFHCPADATAGELSSLEKHAPHSGACPIKLRSCRHANEASPSYLTMLGNGNNMLQGFDRMFPNAFMSGHPLTWDWPTSFNARLQLFTFFSFQHFQPLQPEPRSLS